MKEETDPRGLMTYSLFEVYGIELEYMIVDKTTLQVLPITDKLFYKIQGEYCSEVNRGEITWSNELVVHVLELKVTDPAPTLENLEKPFQKNIQDINQLLESFNAMLMPTAMHPWMDPHAEMKLWPHSQNAVYEAYNRIFNCQGHGWANLQSTHLNLPFSGDDEFASLHAAIRLLLPIMPALAASSPIVEGKVTRLLDYRLEAYQKNAAIIPSIAGKIIPETVTSKVDYQRIILDPMYKDIEPYDTDCLLQEEWLNSRGAIAHYDRSAIEIRVLDIQECPAADIAIVHGIVEVLKDLMQGEYVELKKQQDFSLNELHAIFERCIKNAENTLIDDESYLALFGIQEKSITAGELWNLLLKGKKLHPELQIILNQGTLASRILWACQNNYSKSNLASVYRKLCECLQEGKMFIP